MRKDGREGAREPGTLESVAKALELLLLLRERDELRVTDVSQELGVAPSTSHRLLATLAQSGFVRRDVRTRTYLPGPALVEIALASSRHHDLQIQAAPHLARLSARLRETVHLNVLEGPDVRIIDGVESDQPVRVTVRTGALLPAYSSAAGKILLADLPHHDLRALYPRGLQALTRATVTDMDALERQLETVRTSGFATNMGENEEGLHSAAVPIHSSMPAKRGTVCAALVAALPASRLGPREVPDLVRELSAAATAISTQLQERPLPARRSNR